MGQTHGSSRDEGGDLPGFFPSRVHQLLVEVYGYCLHHNNGMHLDVGILDNALWKCRWRSLDAQLAKWYATPLGDVGIHFLSFLVSEWRGVLDWICNSK